MVGAQLETAQTVLKLAGKLLPCWEQVPMQERKDAERLPRQPRQPSRLAATQQPWRQHEWQDMGHRFQCQVFLAMALSERARSTVW